MRYVNSVRYSHFHGEVRTVDLDGEREGDVTFLGVEVENSPDNLVPRRFHTPRIRARLSFSALGTRTLVLNAG